MRTNGSKKHLLAIFLRDFFMFVLLISNHNGFSRSIWNYFALVSFLKNSQVQINSKLNEKPYDYRHGNWIIELDNITGEG